MRVVIDSNVLYSAAHFPSDRLRVLLEFITDHHTGLLPQYCIDEIKGVTRIKSPDKIPALGEFLASLRFEILPLSELFETTSTAMRDPKDQPILDAAIAADADILLTGDKDFTSLEIGRPRIMTPAEFIAEFLPEQT